MDYTLHGILQAGILEWVATPVFVLRLLKLAINPWKTLPLPGLSGGRPAVLAALSLSLLLALNKLTPV